MNPVAVLLRCGEFLLKTQNESNLEKFKNMDLQTVADLIAYGMRWIPPVQPEIDLQKWGIFRFSGANPIRSMVMEYLYTYICVKCMVI